MQKHEALLIHFNGIHINIIKTHKFFLGNLYNFKTIINVFVQLTNATTGQKCTDIPLHFQILNIKKNLIINRNTLKDNTIIQLHTEIQNSH